MVKNQMDCDQCKEHSGIVHDQDTFKESVTKLFDLVGLLQTTKASSRQLWSGVTIFIIIAMAVIGFLWHSQARMGDLIMNRLNTDAGKRDAIISTMNDVKIQMNRIEVKFEDHVDLPYSKKATGIETK